MSSAKSRRVLPGFGLSMGVTLSYLSLIVLIPLAAVFIKSASLSWTEFWHVATAPRVMASYRLSFGASLLAAAINVVFGSMLAWSLVRYNFPGRRLVDALVDLPFALPTAVAGIALTALYAPNGWLRTLPGDDRDQGCLHAARRARGARVHRGAVHRAHGAARARGPRHRVRGGGREPWRNAPTDHSARGGAGVGAGAADGLCAGLRPRRRRVRIR